MSSLNKLAIRGIRSFDDKQIAVIEFFSPVTVIVGHNGSGKTTIIECLKYATTGDQPPNTRGGAFVHDPKMANEKEVKAQVKLRFHAANGQRMLAVRNLSVTVKKNAALTMKTLESILALADSNAEKAGKRAVISTKCAEIDVEIPHLLGVSKSVLDNVIFCHQEDSYWPLAEPAALKKKFDDIFEATRYTKALDAIKSLRKDRVAELKVDKERLEGLSREKSRADKLKTRVGEQSAAIAAKEVEYDELRRDYEQAVKINAKFYEAATGFRATFAKLEQLEQDKERYRTELDEARATVKTINDTDEQIYQRIENFDQTILQLKQKRQSESNALEDAEEQLKDLRKSQVEMLGRRGELVAQEEVQAQRVKDRDEYVSQIGEKYNLQGYGHGPLSREKVVEFWGKLEDVFKRQRAEVEKLRSEAKQRTEEYNTQSKELTSVKLGLEQEKGSLKAQIDKLNSQVADDESELEQLQAIDGDIQSLELDVQDKQGRVEKLKNELKAGKHDERLSRIASDARTMQERRDELNAELGMLSTQAETRAQLDLKRRDVKHKRQEMMHVLDVQGAKFRKLVGVAPTAENMEQELDRALIEKEAESADVQNRSASANKKLSQEQTTLSGLKSQLTAKEAEVKALNKDFEVAWRDRDLNPDVKIVDALEEAHRELGLSTRERNNLEGNGKAYAHILQAGMERSKCIACNRSLDEHELSAFENHLREQIVRASPEKISDILEEVQLWETQVVELQRLLPKVSHRDRLRDEEIPALKQQIKEREGTAATASEEVEIVVEELRKVQQEMKDMQTLKQHAMTVTRNVKDLSVLEKDIARIEAELSTTGSLRSGTEVQEEIDRLTTQLRENEKGRIKVVAERERLTQTLHSNEKDLHDLQLRQSDLRGKSLQRVSVEKRLGAARKEVAGYASRHKGLDSEIAGATRPLVRLDEEFKEFQGDSNGKISVTQATSQELNNKLDQLQVRNKAIDAYTRERRKGNPLVTLDAELGALGGDIEEKAQFVEVQRNELSETNRQIHEGGSILANLRDNQRLRRLEKLIRETQTTIDDMKIEDAAKARRQFDIKYAGMKAEEERLQSESAAMAGSLVSLKAQLKETEGDLAEFKDIYQQYTDQLIKMSDMANNDLEKYAKALDNAIMKYHSLKMEEVNDTMRHLWNKTYQGTDIDGIKIRSDAEGGATKRSYNYRVVMTKDQVEMDMRGRCSAGQKMLASIIIRLALSDSFGQNCGILALDEPTNALDVENIDALAASLVDIINERKSHANFQLIIITHDENFLRKLGQADVMEYYWRVSRDSRQKSIIERQRIA